METLAQQGLGETHDKPSLEEDDQKNRSNKKIKPNDGKVGNEFEMVDQQIALNTTFPKPSYCEVAMNMEGYQPSPKEIIQMVSEDLCPTWIEEEKALDNCDEMDSKPKIDVSLEEYEEWCRPWKKSLIVNLRS
ncbi:hypothetical protein RIF29_04484 [Crotalaria pallida]|uniref:Uncharacterized protein n=1 Tax=Crotalaria pallida TaxID=3830 RepID=A0AAN9J123_CROPI